MVSYRFELTLLIIFLALLIILKLIFRLSSDGKKDEPKNEKVEKVNAKDADDALNITKAEPITTYIVNDKSNVGKNNYNKDAVLGNYMNDIMVINAPNPNKSSIDGELVALDKDLEQKTKEVKRVYEFNDKIVAKNEDFENANSDISQNDSAIMENLVEIDSGNTKNSRFMKEYRGLSREMKIYLISKILERKSGMREM